MIEYDKADTTSSYPSLTNYEIAVLLDKAYLALLGQKLTGNNLRQMPFEGDNKAIEDIRPLLVEQRVNYKGRDEYISNKHMFEFPNDMLYYIQSMATVRTHVSAIDEQSHIRVPVLLISHNDAIKFMATDYNLPWIKHPVCYMDDESINVLVDSYKFLKENNELTDLVVTYIKNPIKFVDNLDEHNNFSDSVQFELNDSMVEELINLAIVMAAETVESPRQQSKNNLRTLES